MNNKIFKTIVLLAFSLVHQVCIAQTFSGYVKDKKTQEAIIGASVFNLETKAGNQTNGFGFFSFSDISYPAKFSIQSVGYLPDTIILTGPIEKHIFFLEKKNNNLKTVVIISNDNIQPQLQSLSILNIKLMPTLAGEPDVLKSFQLLPGVQGGREGSSGLHVRGGSPDQNLILLDDIALYNVDHIGGFFSIFDVNAINKIDLIKGGFPARYGGRLSSVLDIRMKEGSAANLQGNVDIGLLTTRFSIQGPIKSKTKYIVSFRRCNIDLFSRVLAKIQFDKNSSLGFTFYDAYAKVTHQFDEKNKLSLSAYSGRDKLFNRVKNAQDNYSNKIFDYDNSTQWGNLLMVAKWTNSSIKNLFINTNLAYTKYNYQTNLTYSARESATNELAYSGQNSFESKIDDITAKTEATYYQKSHTIRFGASWQQHTFNPSIQRYKQVSNNLLKDTLVQDTKIEAFETSFFAEDEWQIHKKINLRAGVHGNNFKVSGKNYFSLQPRLALRLDINKNNYFSLGYSQMNQNVHMLSNIGTGIPVDLWLPSTENVGPEKSKQYSLGFYKNNIKEAYNISIEGYYKEITGLIDFSNGQSFFAGSSNWENKIQKNGLGEAYGAELFVEKNSGKLNGFLAYTYSFSNRQFDSINNGDWYPYKYDRRHNFNINLSYPIRKNIILAANFVYQTGHAITLPKAQQAVVQYSTFNRDYVPIFGLSTYSSFYMGGRNQNRMPAYHRSDIAVHFTKEKKRGERKWSVSIYNVYGRLNPYYLYFDYDKDRELHLYQFSLFPFVPSISYSRSWD